MERKTKIIATLGPACASAEGIRALVVAGMDVARLNFSHGTYEAHRQLAGWVREAAEAEDRTVALLQDIQGPKIRTGRFPGGSVELAGDSEVELRPGDREGADNLIFIDYPFLLQDIQVGEVILLADGLIRLRVTAVGSESLTAEVILPGTLGNQKGVAFPDSDLRLPLLTDKDRADLEFGQEIRVDLVAASFVRHQQDVIQVLELTAPGTPVIAKIELALGYENLDQILRRAAGAMVARGDLGVQLPLERIPLVQLDILSRTNASGRVSITATEMLESMTQAPRPTRAEVTDVANAVLSGTDAVMLSGETAVGSYPARAVRAMDVICREVEKNLGSGPIEELLTEEDQIPSATAKAAVESAFLLDIETIVAFTETGSTARLLSKYRPRARIVAFTPSKRTRRQMALLWGVTPLFIDRLDSTDAMIESAAVRLQELGIRAAGDLVVMIAGVPPNQRRSTNLMKLHTI